MFDVNLFLEEFGLELDLESPAATVVACPSERLEEILVYLKNHKGFFLLKGVNCSQNNGRRKVYYWLESLEHGCNLGVSLALEAGEKLNSVASLFKNAGPLEAEMEKACGEEGVMREPAISMQAREKGWTPKETSVISSFVDQKTRSEFWLKGPLDPLGENRLKVTTLWDEVLECGFQLDEKRNSYESRLVGMNVQEVGSGLLKFDGQDGFFWSCLFLKALEEGNGIKIPDKAKAIRTIFMEFARIGSHLEFLARVSHEMEAQVFFHKTLDWLSSLQKLQRLYSGNWFNAGILAFGGANREPPANWISACLKAFGGFQEEMRKEIEKFAQSVFWRQTSKVATVEAADLISWGVTGPDLRASGINFDLRKRRPFYLYDEVEFETPIGIGGSLFDRIMGRMEETLQSAGIIAQLLDNLPTGALAAEEVGHFSRLDPKLDEQQYRKSFQGPDLPGEGLYQDSIETSSGMANVFFRLREGKVADICLSDNGYGKVLCVEEMAQGATFSQLPLLVKSMRLNLRTIEK